MKYPVCFVAEKGCREFLKTEIQEIIGEVGKNTHCDSVLLHLDEKKLVKTLYKSQTVNTALLFLKSFRFESEKALIKKIRESSFKDVNKHLLSSYKVVCERQGTHDFTSVELEKKIYDTIQSNIEAQADVRNPHAKLTVLIRDDEVVFGINLSTEELTKRNYKIFNNSRDLRATIAASFLIFSGFSGEKTVFNPYSLGGTLVIEAALKAANKSVRYYTKDVLERIRLKGVETRSVMDEEDEKIKEEIEGSLHSFDKNFRNLSSQKKNSKIAGVDKIIDFAKVHPTQADLRFERDSVDLIMSRLIEPTNKLSADDVEELYDTMIYRFEYVLKPKASICLILEDEALFTKKADEFGFFLKEKKEVYQGQLKLNFVRYAR